MRRDAPFGAEAAGLGGAPDPAATDALSHLGVISDDLSTAVGARIRDDPGAFEAALDRLITAGRPRLSAALDGRLQTAVAGVWARGWQPVDIVRAIGQAHGARHVALVRAVIARQSMTYAEARLDDRWVAQVATLGSPVWDGPEAFLDRWAAAARCDPFEVVRFAVEVLSTVETRPAVPLLMPAPGQPGAPSVRRRRATDDPTTRMLDRIRALLAKAESSGYASEAEAYTAKAQELTTLHRIDQAQLGGWADGPDEPAAIRVAIDRPYEDAKALLLQSVAEANLAQAVWSSGLGFSTVFGFPDDLATVELIYTSLLVQGTAIMVREGSGRRAREFRESFLLAYAARIGERLRASSVRAAGTADLLPVLASREAAVRQKAADLFGGFTTGRSRIRDGRGWRSGTAAADIVDFSASAGS